MEKTEIMFLSALRCALMGEKADITLSREEWMGLLDLAQTHKVLPMILEAVHACPSLRELGEGELALLRRRVRHQVMMQTLRTGDFLAVNRKLREAGIRPLVVKGIICRALYPNPDQRPSGDEDVLVAPEKFDLCCRELAGLGLERAGEEADTAYEIPFSKPGSPLRIELHRYLFPPESAAYGDTNRFFGGVFDRAVEEALPGGPVLTMPPTDHLFFLICHAFKHFLHSGFGIRQVCDIILYASRYGSRVEWEQVLANCEAIRAEKFAAAVFRIGENHLGIRGPELFRMVQTEEELLLLDLLQGGLYGDASMSRKHSSNITLDAMTAQKQGRQPRGALRTSLFPSAEAMAGKYPYLKEKRWLLPVAWGQRIWRYSRETRATADNSAAEALKIGADRVELMKHYGILD